MSWKEALKEDIKIYFDLPTDSSIVEWREVTKSMGFCNTCYSESLELEITVKDSDGLISTENYTGSFMEFLSSLDYRLDELDRTEREESGY